MASRMEKYYHDNSDVLSRESKNTDLYADLYDNVKYSNVEGIANIEKSNQIDIQKIKKLISECDDTKDNTTFIRKTVVNITPVSEELEDKNYDLKELLVSAKKSRPKVEKERYVQDINNVIINKLKELSKEELQSDENSTNDSLKDLNDNELSLNLLDNLKSDDNTFITDLSDRIKDKTEEMDTSFYTSSMNFNSSDFEELDGINENLKKKNIWIIILIIFLIIIVLLIGFFVFKYVL